MAYHPHQQRCAAQAKQKPLDLTKPVRTRDGRKARIVCTDVDDGTEYPILALVKSRLNGKEESYSYRICGSYSVRAVEDPSDLVNVEPLEVFECEVGIKGKTICTTVKARVTMENGDITHIEVLR